MVSCVTRVLFVCLSLQLSLLSICCESKADCFSSKENADENDPGLLSLVKLTNPEAVCLDGSPGAYYFRPGYGTGTNKWYIYHEGGGWCSSLDDCVGRSKGHLGSSSNYSSTCAESAGFFNPDSRENPLVYNWNRIYLKYCDGLSFSGFNYSSTFVDDTELYFRGKVILNAGLEDWLSKGITSASDIIISGCSAGGLATYLHCDYYTQWMNDHKIEARISCIPQSGTFLDFDLGKHHYHSYMTWAFYQHNASVNAECLRHNALEPSKCIFAENAMKFIQTPTFPLQSRFDSWSIGEDLSSRNVEKINEWGNRLTNVLWNNLLLRDVRHGVFLDSCFHHCGYWRLPIENRTMITAFQKWYDNKVGAQLVWIQDDPYPCEECCKTNPPPLTGEISIGR